MSSEDPNKEKQVHSGVSKKILVVDYLPTQAILEDIGGVFPHDESLSEISEYDPEALGPYTLKNSDLVRYHTRRYFRDFALNPIKEGVVWAINYGAADFFNSHIFSNPIIDPKGDWVLGTEGTFPDNIEWIATEQTPKYSWQDPRTTSPPLWLALRADMENRRNQNYSPFWMFLSNHVAETENTNPLRNYRTQDIVIVYDRKVTGDERGINTYNDFTKFMKGFPADQDSVRVGSLNLTKQLVNTPHTDHVCDYEYPLSKGEAEKAQIPIKTLYADLKEEYNFYIRSYATAINNIKPVLGASVNIERLIPNIYLLMGSNYSKKKLLELNKTYRNALTLNEGKLVKQLLSGTDKIEFGAYFLTWAMALRENSEKIINKIQEQEGNISKIYNQSKNIIIPPQKTKNILSDQENKNLFPMYTELEFSTDMNSKFGKLLIDSGQWSSLLSYAVIATDLNIVGNISGVGITSKLFKGYAQQNILLEDDALYSSKIEQIPVSDFDKFSVRSIDLVDWLEASNEPGKYYASPASWHDKNYIILDPDTNASNTLDTYQPSPIMKKIMGLGFRSKFKKIITNNLRSYAGIISGKKCYAETVFYRIEKKNASSGDIIQNIWFVNDPEVEVIKYIDTQVIYDKEYEYKIFAWKLVIGNKYLYNAPSIGDSIPPSEFYSSTSDVMADNGFRNFIDNLDPDNEFAAIFGVHNHPSIQLMEFPYYEPGPIKVLDDPPPPPSATMVPYRAVPDRVLIALTQETGEYLLDPVHLNPEEYAKIQEFRKAKGYNSIEKILFKSDDPFGYFEIFRMTKKPKSYSDFNGSKIVDLVPGTDTFIDRTVMPNTKYYYMFRVVDVNEHLSNPSAIYEFEIVKNSKSIYPVTKVVDIEDYKIERALNSKSYKKDFRKYLRITPAETQIGLNYNNLEDEIADADTATEFAPNVGRETTGLIGKKFKIRLTSKQTGKQVDLNLNFKSSWAGNIIDEQNKE